MCVCGQVKHTALVNPKADYVITFHTPAHSNNGRLADVVCVKPASRASESFIISLSSIKNAKTLARDPDFPHLSEARLLTASV